MSEQAASKALRFASIAEDDSEVGQRDACLIEVHLLLRRRFPPDTSVNELRAVCPGLVFADDRAMPPRLSFVPCWLKNNVSSSWPTSWSCRRGPSEPSDPSSRVMRSARPLTPAPSGPAGQRYA